MNSAFPESTKIIFISDAHLGGFSPEKNARIEIDLLELVNYAEKNDYRIAILGDLFDYWMEYKNYVPQIGQKLLNRFAVFNRSNPSLYITGNHDNWTQDYFKKHGFDVERDYRLIAIGSKKVLLLHGDAIGEDLENLKRPLLHRIMRNKIFVKLYKIMFWPPKRGIRVMKRYSRFTNWLAGKENPAPLDRWGKKMLQSNVIDIIICGHDHVPRVQKFDFGTYLNTGAFHHHKTLVTYNNRRFQLVCWSSEEQELTPFSRNF